MLKYSLETLAYYTHLYNKETLQELENKELVNQEEINSLANTLKVLNKYTNKEHVMQKLDEVESLSIVMQMALEGSNALDFEKEEVVMHLEELHKKVAQGLRELHMMLEAKVF